MVNNGKNLWHWLSLDDEQLGRADVVALNLAVAREIPGLQDLDVDRYCQIVDEWTSRFAAELPGMEAGFQRTPWKWKNDLRFFRVGMLQGFLGHEIGISYIDEQKYVDGVHYTDPSDLFLNGLIDRKQGTCGNMAALHVAISRRMGWPVSLACAKAHFISRYDDGQVYHNIEATSTHQGSFCSDPDEVYVKKFSLPKIAITSGSDLRCLTMREMAGAFVSLRARHLRDIGQLESADRDYALSRALFHRYRYPYIGGMVPMLRHGERLFEPGELGHPNSLFEDFGNGFGANRRAPEVHILQPPVFREGSATPLSVQSAITLVPDVYNFSLRPINNHH